MKFLISLAGGGGSEDSHIDKYFAEWNGTNGKMLYSKAIPKNKTSEIAVSPPTCRLITELTCEA